jgi:hypothetical protein
LLPPPTSISPPQVQPQDRYYNKGEQRILDATTIAIVIIRSFSASQKETYATGFSEIISKFTSRTKTFISTRVEIPLALPESLVESSNLKFKAKHRRAITGTKLVIEIEKNRWRGRIKNIRKGRTYETKKKFGVLRIL